MKNNFHIKQIISSSALILIFACLININYATAGTRHVFNYSSIQKIDTLGGGCEANFSYTVISGDSVQFTNLSYSSDTAVRYHWDFGDGDTSNMAHPTHEYASSAYYQVCLNIYSDSGCTSQFCQTVAVGPKTGCQAYFTVNVISSDSVQFNNQSTTQDSVAQSLWIFGDGDSSTAKNPTHVYSSYGVYSVCLYITSAGGCTASWCEDTGVTVGECSAQFTYSYVTGSTVNFNGNPTSAASVTSYSWSFGDGATNTTSLTPSHSYAADGSYKVIFSMVASNGCTAADTQYIRVPEPMCNASFTYTTDGDTVFFTNTSTSNGSLTYNWEFYGGGPFNEDTSTAENAMFVTPGNLDSFACLTIISDSGCTATYCNQIIFGGSVVWPGDANDDLYVNNEDLIPIGLYYGETGPARDTVTNVWAPHPSSQWGSAQSNGRNLKYVDCNGDGVINSDDTMAVYLNYGDYHPDYSPRAASRSTNGSVPLSIVTDSSYYHIGSRVHASVMLGTSTNQASDVYGLAYTITVDNSIVTPGSMSFVYDNSSFLGVKNSNVLVLTHINNGVVGTAVTGIDHNNRSGYGKIGDLYFTLASNTNAQQTIAINSDLSVDATGDTLAVQPVSDTVQVATGIAQLPAANNQISIYPNPGNGLITINSANTIDQIKVTNVLGQLIYEEQPSQPHLTIQINDDGIYFIAVTSNHQTATQKIVVAR